MISLLIALAALISSPAHADPYHYRNVLIGERSAGLGGSFTAISDDPSGVYYNPAGLVFANENYYSLSAHAYSNKKQVYKNIVPGKDYTYTSSALIPAFFGFTQSVGRHKAGFVLLVSNSELIDQDDTLANVNTATDTVNTLKRRVFAQDTTYLLGPGFATEVFNNFTIGISTLLVLHVDKFIDQQFIIYNPVDTGKYANITASQSRSAQGLLPKIGFQYMPISKWAIGAAVSRNYTISGSGTFQSVSPKLSGNVPIINGTINTDQTVTSSANVFHNLHAPYQIDAGTAFFFSRSWLLTADINYYTADKNYLDYSVQSVLNWSAGTEYYLGESLAIRGGAYSNKANSPALSASRMNQAPHVDLYAGSLGLSFYRPGTSLSVTGTYSYGNGKGQAIGDTTASQDINERGYSVTFSGSYQL